MDVKIKDFDVRMEIRNNGIELEVKRPNNGDHLGDLVLTKTQVIWCEGRTRRENGISVTWDQFIRMMNERDA